MKRKSLLRNRLAPSIFSARRSARSASDANATGRVRFMRSPHFEPLEGRSLLAADFLITEFMADNDGKPVESGLPFLDEDGDQSDWIEIQNVGNAAGSLVDWALEDDVDRWVFPNVTVQPGAFIVVFASNKDRTDPASELHTNFALSNTGERLALVRPDDTIRQQFDPYPQQPTDVSYGIVQDGATLLASGAAAKIRVPTAADGSGTAWTGLGFNETGFSSSLGSGVRNVLITEINTAAVDFFEIQNVTNTAVNTTGWVVAINDGNGTQTINQVDPITWTIGGSMSANQVRFRTESVGSPDYFGSPIDWPGTASRGWVMIVDNLGNVVDFVVWGYTAGEVASMNVTVGGFNINSQKIAGAWNGNPIAHNNNSSLSLQRQGSVDHNTSAGWGWVSPTSQNVQNSLLVTPVSGPAIPVTTGIGYNTNPSGFNVKYVKANVFVTDTFVAQQVLDTPAQQTQVINETVATVNYNSNGGSAHFGGDRAFPGHAFPGQDVNDFVIEATGTIVFPNAGQWTFGVNSDDGFRLEVTNGVHSFLTEYPPPRGSADTLATFSIPDGGAYQVRLLFYERGGGACVELFAALGARLIQRRI